MPTKWLRRASGITHLPRGGAPGALRTTVNGINAMATSTDPLGPLPATLTDATSKARAVVCACALACGAIRKPRKKITTAPGKRARPVVQMHMRLGALLILATPAGFAEDASAIMARVQPTLSRRSKPRREYVYQQTVRASLIKQDGQLAAGRSANTRFVPSPMGAAKKLVSIQGEYRKGKQSLTYTAPDHQHGGVDANCSKS
jgi:hypothetical protein